MYGDILRNLGYMLTYNPKTRKTMARGRLRAWGLPEQTLY